MNSIRNFEIQTPKLITRINFKQTNRQGIAPPSVLLELMEQASEVTLGNIRNEYDLKATPSNSLFKIDILDALEVNDKVVVQTQIRKFDKKNVQLAFLVSKVPKHGKWVNVCKAIYSYDLDKLQNGAFVA